MIGVRLPATFYTLFELLYAISFNSMVTINLQSNCSG